MRLPGVTISAVAFCLTACGCDRVAEPAGVGLVSSTTTTTRSTLVLPLRCVGTWGSKPAREPFPAGFLAPSCPDHVESPDEEPFLSLDVKLPTGTVTFPDAPGTPRIEVEMALTPPARRRGLMLRRSMAEDHGLVFVHDEETTEHELSIRYTCIPLDILFIDRAGYVADIQENVPPMSENRYSSTCPSSHVIEVNAGWSRRHGVAPGQRARLSSS